MTAQLDFFDRLESTATILAFPPRRLVALIKRAAWAVHTASPSKRAQTLLNEVGFLQLAYMQNGIEGGKAYHLANGFEEEVLAELRRLKARDRRSDPRELA